MRPVLDLNLSLTSLLHAAGEHGTEVLALSREDGFVGENLLALDEEDHICEGRIVNNLPHVLNQTVYRLIVYLIFL